MIANGSIVMGGQPESTFQEADIAAPIRAALPGARAIRSCLQLMRPANLCTAVADVLAGFAVAGASGPAALPWLILATVGLYAGGVVLNDVFDAPVDARERPERPIPSGRVSRGGAAWLGGMLLLAGVGAAAAAGPESALIALAIALLAVSYDGWGKHRALLGPLNMGLCRGLNLLLGVSAAPLWLEARWPLALLPLAYVVAITTLSRGEVHGGRWWEGNLSLSLMSMVLLSLPMLALLPAVFLPAMVPFVAVLAWRVWPPFWRAGRSLEADDIRRAVRAGVLSLILLDASLAAGFAGLFYGVGVAALLLVAAGLARRFAVT